MTSAKDRLAAKMAGFGDRIRKDLAAAEAAAGAPAASAEPPRAGALRPVWQRERIAELESELEQARARLGELQDQAPGASGQAAIHGQAEQQLAEARARADQLDRRLQELLAAGVIVQIPLADLIDSPFQPRLRYDPAELEALAQSLAAQGQKSLIVVRKRADGKFELLEGHRRKRGAAAGGLASLRAVVVECSDDEAFLTVTTAATAVTTTTEYEKARTFKAALDRNPDLKQGDVARLYAVHRTRVSQCLAMFDLPQRVLDMLEVTPDLLGADRVREIQDLRKAHPEREDVIVEAVERLRTTPRLSLTSYVATKVKQQEPSAGSTRTTRERVLKDRSGQPIGRLAVGKNVATVRLEPGIDAKKFVDALAAALAALDVKSL